MHCDICGFPDVLWSVLDGVLVLSVSTRIVFRSGAVLVNHSMLDERPGHSCDTRTYFTR